MPHLEAICGVPAAQTLGGGAPWWRPLSSVSTQPSTVVAAASGSNVAFIALISFTAILLLSPQAWFPALKVVRIAFLAAGVAMAAHVVDRTMRRQPITPVS